MASTHSHETRESAWKSIWIGTREAIIRAGDWSHRKLKALEWNSAKTLYTALSLVIGLIAAAILWLYFLDWNTMRGPVSRYLSYRLGREVKIEGTLDVNLFSWTPTVNVSGLKIGNPSWLNAPQAADIRHMVVSARLLSILRGHWVLPLVRLDEPTILITRRADGHTNWEFAGERGEGWELPPINRFYIRNGHVRIDDQVRKLVFVGTVSSEERRRGEKGSAFTLNGDGTLNGNRFTAEVHGGPLIHVDETKPYNFTALVTAGATRVTADGSITHPFNLNQFVAKTTIRGANLSDLYLLTGLAMPHTAPYNIKGTLTRDGSIYRFERFTGVVGQSDLAGNLTVDGGRTRPLITGAVHSRVLDFKDLGELFGGKSATAEATGRLLPDLPLHTERLRQMDADVTYDAEDIRSRDFPIRGMHTRIRLENSVRTLQPLRFQFAAGSLSGLLKIDARRAVPLTTVDARFTNMKVEQFLSGTPPIATGMLQARVQLSGSGKSVKAVASTANGPVTFVVPHGQFQERLAELTGINLFNGLFTSDKEQTTLRCAVAHFDTRGGVMRAQRFVFDTEPVRIEGKGVINLADETLNVRIIGKPKEFRIGRIHAPILVTGPLASPHVGIEPSGAIIQGGLAVALGFLFPPAAILPFVDPGLAKDANCSAAMADPAVAAPRRRHR